MSAFAGYISFDGEHDPSVGWRLGAAVEGSGSEPVVARSVPPGSFVFRQRILSPEDRFERQPCVGLSGLVSMFDGRLDNRGDLLRALGSDTGAQSTVADGEIVRRAYEKWAEHAPERLLGDFAWAIWDPARQRLMLARDHSLERSLYFSRGRGFVAFATGYRPLLALPQISPEIDERAIADMLLTSMSEDDGSFYKAISWVGAAERVLVTASEIRRDRLWEPRAGAASVPRRDEEIIEQGRALFDEAVKCRLRVLGPIVSSVSGGLDSSAVAATAARLRPGDTVHAICIVPDAERAAPCPPGQFADERPYVTALAAQHPNMHAHFPSCTGLGYFQENASNFFLRFGAPMWAANNGGWALTAYEHADALGARTMLIGMLGNLTVSARGWERLGGLGAEGKWMRLASELSRVALGSAPDRKHIVRHSLAKTWPALAGAARRLRPSGATSWSDGPVPLNPDFVVKADFDKRWSEHGIVMLDRWAPDARERSLRFVMLRSRMAAEARAAMRMVSDVTAADPFSHRPLIDFCLSLPADQFMRGGVGRRLARSLFADRLPAEIVNNQQIGLQNADWHARLHPSRDDFVAQAEALANSPLASRILDVPRIRRALEEWPSEPHQAMRERWLERHVPFRALHVGRFLKWVEGGNC